MYLLAHALQVRGDLPIPLSIFYWAAGIVLVVSFAALSLLWHRPLVARHEGDVRMLPWLDWLYSPPVLWTLRVLVLAITAFCLLATLIGADSAQNIAITAVFVKWWIGIVAVSVLLGNVWRALNPWATLARLLRFPLSRPDRPYPAAIGVWPAVPVILLFAWTELIYDPITHVPFVAAEISLYSLWTLAGMWWYGIAPWLDNAEAFTVYTSVLSRLSIVETRQEQGRDGRLHRRLGLRWPVVATLRTRARPGIVAFITTLIGTVSFDGFSRTNPWQDASASVARSLIASGLGPDAARTIVWSFGLAIVVLIAYGAFEIAALMSDIVGGMAERVSVGRVADLFIHSLIPIAFAYNLAHYFTYFVYQSQDLVRLASDPFGTGHHDYFGTANFHPNYNLIPGNAVWYVQTAAIVIGHVTGLVLAHDRALELCSESRKAVRSQYVMLCLMLLYTLAGLYFLSAALV